MLQQQRSNSALLLITSPCQHAVTLLHEFVDQALQQVNRQYRHLSCGDLAPVERVGEELGHDLLQGLDTAIRLLFTA
jgi:hypothetical protein